MPDQFDYRESIGGLEPGGVTYSRTGGGGANLTQYVGACGGDSAAFTSVAQIHGVVDDILGWTKVHSDGIRLNRKLPKAFPREPGMYASRVFTRGFGRMTKVDSDPGQVLEADAFDEMAFYPGYRCEISFDPLPYALIGDDQITTGTITWVDKYGATHSSKNYAKEWLRYTDIDRMPQTETITVEAGQIIFDIAAATEPHGREAGKGQIQMQIPKSAIVLTWYDIPFTYLDGFAANGTRVENYVEQGMGCINQFDWYGFEAGTLLLVGVKVSRHPPPRQELKLWQGTAIYAAQKLCDISFMFLRQKVTITSAANAPPNTNIIRAGHNLLPWAHTGGWYFAKTNVAGVAAADGRGVYPSFPAELLFTNPGVS